MGVKIILNTFHGEVVLHQKHNYTYNIEYYDVYCNGLYMGQLVSENVGEMLEQDVESLLISKGY